MTNLYAPVRTWVTFYDPQPVSTQEGGAPAYRTLEESSGSLGRNATVEYNNLLSRISFRAIAPASLDTKLNPDVPEAGYWWLDAVFEEPDGVVADQLSLMLGEGVPIDAEVEFLEQPGTLFSFRGIIVSRTFMVQAEGLIISVRAIAQEVARLFQARQVSVPARKDETIEIVMQRLAQALKWDSRRLIVQRGARLVKDVNYCGGNVFVYFKQLRAALDTASAEGGSSEPYEFFVDRRGYLHAHQVHWQPHVRQEAELPLIRIRGAQSTVLDFQVQTQLFKVAQLGLMSAIELGWTTRQATGVVAAGGIERQQAVAAPDSTAVPVGLGSAMPILPIFANTDEERRAKMAAIYDHLRRAAVMATVRMQGRADIDLFDHVYVSYILRNGVSHYLSGTYIVLGIEHEISDIGWLMTASLFRISLGETDPAAKAGMARVDPVAMPPPATGATQTGIGSGQVITLGKDVFLDSNQIFGSRS